MRFFVEILAHLVLFLNITVMTYAGIKLVQKFFSTPVDDYVEAFESFIDSRYRELALLTALVSTSGSLFLSQVMGWTPCDLCWYQRIFMYPLVVIFASSLFFNNKNVSDYAIPMTVIGAGISIYHYFVQVMSEIQSGCAPGGVDCSTTHTFYFDYMSIPIMALTGFVIIFILSYRNWD